MITARKINHLSLATLFIFISVLFLSSVANAADCSNGCVKLCNKTGEKVTMAIAYMDGPLSCPFSGKGCYVKTEGWWTLENGQCFTPETGYWWITQYSIAEVDRNTGKRRYPSWPVKERLLSGDIHSGMSGYYPGTTMCVKKNDVFSRTVSGRVNDAFNKTCPAGYDKSKVNFYTRGKPDTIATYTLR